MDSEQQVLEAVLDRYGLCGAKTELLGSLWNRVYRVESENGELFSLRVCPPTYQARQCVEDELVWLGLLKSQRQLNVPIPVRNQEHGLVTVVSTAESQRLSCLFNWVDGEPAKGQLTPDAMRGIGRITATLHDASRQAGKSFHHSSFRDGYHYGSRLATSHRDWITEHHAKIGEECVVLLNKAVTWLEAAFERIGETPDNFGLIHADLHFGNFLIHEGTVSIIDFDQLGHGHYLYDLAILQTELFNEAGDHANWWCHFKAGYKQVTPLPFKEESELNPFIVAVELAFLDWVYNTPNPDVVEQMGKRIPAIVASIRAGIGLIQQ